MTLVELLIYTLATWRISSLISTEEGPFNIFGKFREVLPSDSFLENLISCIWCLSVWIALGWVGFIALFPSIAIWVALPFALSAGAIIVDSMVYDDDYET